jgi:hypothetical protein
VYLYYRLFDPIVQSTLWLYIKDILDNPIPSTSIHVISYENPQFPLTPEQGRMAEAWQEQGLEWTALSWHQGIGLGQKLTDFLAGLRAVFNLRRRGARYIVTLCSVGGSFAYLYSRLLGMRLFLYSFEPHSEYGLDNGIWGERSIQYRLLRLLERRAAAFAVVIASGTRFMEELLRDTWRVTGRYVKIPCVADDQKFLFDPELRGSVRRELGFTDENYVLLYTGKFGGLYPREETAWMFRWLLDLEQRLRFLIITPNEDDEIHELFDRAGVPRESYTIRHSDYSSIHGYYFAADLGVVAVTPGPSKKYMSSIKVGEYLCAGLPFLTPRGVSEDYLHAEEQHVGVVVNSFAKEDIQAAWPQIRSYLEMDPDERRRHCRKVGLGYRGFAALNPRFRSAVATLLGDKE